jgi:hypothetical protein
VQTPRPLKQEIERCDAPAAARRFITAAPRLELDDLGRRQHPFVGGVSCVVDVVTRAWPIRRRGPLGTTGYGAQSTPSATTAFSRLPPFIGSILRAAKGRLDPFAAPFGYDCNLRIGVIHCVVFARQQSPKRVPAQVPGWPLTLEVRLPKLPELPNLPSLVVSNK